jgi:hypothetical protein
LYQSERKSVEKRKQENVQRGHNKSEKREYYTCSLVVTVERITICVHKVRERRDNISEVREKGDC